MKGGSFAGLLVLLCFLATAFAQDAAPHRPLLDEIEKAERPAFPIEDPDAAAPEQEPPPAAARSPFGALALMGPRGSGAPGYRGPWFPSQPVRGRPTNLGFHRHELNLGCPLWMEGPDAVIATAGVTGSFFQTQAVLPDTGRPFPQELWNIRFGVLYSHQFDNGWSAGGRVSIGSASDRPFSRWDVLTPSVQAFLRVPSGERNAWMFTLMYSPTSQLPFPLPGLAYTYEPSDRFTANIGLPFVVVWRPTDQLTLEAFYLVLYTVRTRATWAFTPKLQSYVGFDWNNEAYLLADRQQEEDRFLAYDKRVTLGVQVDLHKHVTLDCSGGYSFDRFYFEGRGFNIGHRDRVDVGNGPFGSVQLRARW
jgi:hypothetical protein